METWTSTWALRNLIAELLMPPGIWIFLGLFAILIIRRHQTILKIKLVFVLLMIWLTSTTYFSEILTRAADHYMHWPAPLQMQGIQKQAHQNKKNQAPNQAQAIVVLGGGRRQGVLEFPEYQNQDLSPPAMVRVRYAAKLAKATGLPILLTGGAPDATGPNDLSEAQIMARVLHDEFGIKARWIEGKSETTQENAQFSAKILEKENIHSIYLVTHFWHMPRAEVMFKKEGLQITPAPVGFYLKDKLTPLDYTPGNDGFQRTRWVWHELMGQFMYKLKS